MHVAANEGHDEVVALLLEKGANPEVTVNGLKARISFSCSLFF